MLELVRGLGPTLENLYIVAKDIFEHSEKLSGFTDNEFIASIMYRLERESVFTIFVLE